MIRRLCLWFLLLFCCTVQSQQNNKIISISEVIDEWAAEVDGNFNYEEVYERLDYLSSNPLNLNDINLVDLNGFPFLDESLLDELRAYRREYGDFQSIYELQSVEGFNYLIINRLLPFVEVKPRDEPVDLRDDIKYLKGQVLARSSIRIGSKSRLPWAHLLKTKIETRRHFRAGFTMEKDAGEHYWQGPKGLAFFSAHCEVRDLGIIKKFIVGDFVCKFGEGLASSSGFQFNKGAKVLQLPHYVDRVAKFSSVDGVTFFRGIASTIILQKNRCEMSIWASPSNGIGMSVDYQASSWDAGLFANKHNLSSSYRYRISKLLLYGEFALDRVKNYATVNGLNYKVSTGFYLSLLYRNYHENYDSRYAASFSESSEVNNESGLYAGFQIQPSSEWVLSIYLDRWRFPIPTHLVNYPNSKGHEMYMQIEYRGNNQSRIFIRAKKEFKDKVGKSFISNPEVRDVFQYVRIQYENQLTPFFQIKSRLESNYSVKTYIKTVGYLFSQDFIGQINSIKSKVYLRYAYFNADTFENRFHVYENDLLYSFSIPSYQGHGHRYYVMSKVDLLSNLHLWFKWSQVFTNSLKSDFRVQLQWKF